MSNKIPGVDSPPATDEAAERDVGDAGRYAEQFIANDDAREEQLKALRNDDKRSDFNNRVRSTRRFRETYMQHVRANKARCPEHHYNELANVVGALPSPLPTSS